MKSGIELIAAERERQISEIMVEAKRPATKSGKSRCADRRGDRPPCSQATTLKTYERKN